MSIKWFSDFSKWQACWVVRSVHLYMFWKPHNYYNYSYKLYLKKATFVVELNTVCNFYSWQSAVIHLKSWIIRSCRIWVELTQWYLTCGYVNSRKTRRNPLSTQVTLSGPMDWILRYIKSTSFFTRYQLKTWQTHVDECVAVRKGNRRKHEKWSQKKTWEMKSYYNCNTATHLLAITSSNNGLLLCYSFIL